MRSVSCLDCTMGRKHRCKVKEMKKRVRLFTSLFPFPFFPILVLFSTLLISNSLILYIRSVLLHDFLTSSFLLSFTPQIHQCSAWQYRFLPSSSLLFVSLARILRRLRVRRSISSSCASEWYWIITVPHFSTESRR